MKISRREFVATTITGAAGIYAGGLMTKSLAAEAPVQLPEEDGYKLWLRYAPPGDAVKSYRQIVRQISVVGTSATCGIIRDEMQKATAAMFGAAVPLTEKRVELQDGTLSIGKLFMVQGSTQAPFDMNTLGDEGY